MGCSQIARRDRPADKDKVANRKRRDAREPVREEFAGPIHCKNACPRNWAGETANRSGAGGRLAGARKQRRRDSDSARGRAAAFSDKVALASRSRRPDLTKGRSAAVLHSSREAQ